MTHDDHRVTDVLTDVRLYDNFRRHCLHRPMPGLTMECPSEQNAWRHFSENIINDLNEQITSFKDDVGFHVDRVEDLENVLESAANMLSKLVEDASKGAVDAEKVKQIASDLWSGLN